MSVEPTARQDDKLNRAFIHALFGSTNQVRRSHGVTSIHNYHICQLKMFCVAETGASFAVSTIDGHGRIDFNKSQLVGFLNGSCVTLVRIFENNGRNGCFPNFSSASQNLLCFRNHGVSSTPSLLSPDVSMEDSLGSIYTDTPCTITRSSMLRDIRSTK
jgi:hypothetical protein